MGVRVTESGISIQFCDKDGKADGVPVFGRYAALSGLPRDEALKASGVAATPDELKFQGSDDWLTLIAVADTEDKLHEILRETGSSMAPPDTSGSSRRSQIELNVGGVRQSFRNRIAIASGPILRIKPPKIDVVHVTVLPEGIALGDLYAENPLNPLVAEFVGNSPLFE